MDFQLPPIEKRIHAAIIDAAVYSALWFVIAILLDPGLDKVNRIAEITLGIQIIYLMAAYSISGQTLGKFLVGIKVVSVDGQSLNWGRGVLRTVGLVVGALPFLLGYLWPFFDRKRQAGHDKIAGTVVVFAWMDRRDVPEFLASLTAVPVRSRQGILFGIVWLGISFCCLSILVPPIAELATFDPWPASDVAPVQLVSPRLSHLDFAMISSGDARENPPWQDSTFAAGAYSEYARPDGVVLRIWVLKYDTLKASTSDYHTVASATERSCTTRGQFNDIFWHDYLRCQYRSDYAELLWNKTWMIYLEVRGEQVRNPEAVARAVHFALASLWREV